MANRIFAFVLLLIIVVACSQQKEEGVTDASSKKDSIKICATNPNGTSELAQLMREMYSHLSSIRSASITGNITGEMPEFLKTIHTANPTDSTMVDEEFDKRADEYLAAVKDLYHRYPESQKIAFNTAVSKCESCHTHYCPGPLGKIRKLYIKF